MLHVLTTFSSVQSICTLCCIY